MENELKLFEEKVAHLLKISSRLRIENQQLRKEMIELRSNNQQYAEKLGHVKVRLEKLLDALPDKNRSIPPNES